jgi:hypothetical protein
MNKIIYSKPDGSLCVVSPAEGRRLANSITLSNGMVVSSTNPPQPVDTIMRTWPVAGATADWVETEDEFLNRIKAKDVPSDAITPVIVDAAAIPADRSKRRAWRQNGALIEIDATISAQIDAQNTRTSTDEAERAECKGDGTLMVLLNQTRPEWRTWAQNNFPTLTLAEQNKLGNLFWIVAVGVRKNVRV